VILFALIYLRNSAVSPKESFPICQKNGLKFFPIRHEFSQNGSSLDSRACKHRVSISCVIILILWKRFCEPDESPWCLMCVCFLMSCKMQIRHAHFFPFLSPFFNVPLSLEYVAQFEVLYLLQIQFLVQLYKFPSLLKMSRIFPKQRVEVVLKKGNKITAIGSFLLHLEHSNFRLLRYRDRLCGAWKTYEARFAVWLQIH